MQTSKPSKKKKNVRSKPAPKQGRSPELADLRERLREAEETLEAIRTGAVDAVIVSGREGQRVYRLQGADQSYRLLVESISEGVVTLSPEGVILYCNRQFADLVGIPDERIVGSSFLNLVAREDYRLFHEFFSSNIRSTCRYRVVLKSANARDPYVQVSLGYADQAGAGVVTAVVSDLTEQMLHLEVLKEERLSRAIINQVPLAIAVCDREGRVIRSSPALLDLCRENPNGRTFDEHFHLLLTTGRSQSELFSATALLRGETIERKEGVLCLAMDRIVHVILDGRPLLDEENHIIGCLIVLLDISDHKKAEYKLRAAHHQLEMATLAAEAGTWDWNIRTGDAEWSDNTFNLYGLDPGKDKPSTAKWRSVVHPDDIEKARQRIQNALNNHEPYVGDYRIVKPDGQIRWISSRGRAIYDENGKSERMIGICMDNTRQKLAEARIVRQNALLDGINRIFQETAACQTEQELAAACLEVALDLTESKFGFIGELDPGGWIRDLTTRSDNDPVKSIRLPKQVNPQSRYEQRGLVGQVFKKKESIFVNEPAKIAKSVSIPKGWGKLTAFLAAPFISEEKAVGIIALCNRSEGYTAIQQDLLEDLAPSILQAIAAKRQAIMINHQANLLSMANDAVIAFDLEKKITFWNLSAIRMYGWTVDEATGRTVEDLMSPTADPAVITLRDCCMNRGEIFRDEFVHRRKDGSTFWVEESSCALLDEDRQIYGFVTVNRNITNRKNVEKERKEWTARLEAANRDLESFSYSVSHDLRAPLRAIDGYSRMILRKHAADFDEDAVSKFNEIRLNTQKMGQLIDDLLNFSRMGRVDLAVKNLDMETIIADVWRELTQQPAERKMTFTLNRPIPDALGDPAMIRQVVSNLLDNAIKFTAHTPETVIEVGGQAGPEENIYYVRDNGAGFDMQYYGKLFGVFQRLHSAEDFPGTGVGLATIQRILKRQDGKVWAEAEPGKGACFYFSLPQAKS